MKTWIGLTLLLLALPSVFSNKCKKEGSNLLIYGPTCNDLTTPREDDGATEEISLLHSFTLLGETHRSCFVNNNGVISFKGSVESYTPDGFPLPQYCMLSPYWGDVDNEDNPGTIYYRQTKDPEFLDCLSLEINKLYEGLEYKAAWAFVATWHEVHYHGSESNKTNTFQCVLVSDNHQRSIVLYLYDQITWTTGTASGGHPKTGLGGIPAQAGINTPHQYFNMPMSRTEHIVNIASTSNVGCPGVWIFRADKLMVPGGCLHKDSFLTRGQTVWMDDECANKCVCKHNGIVECEDEGCDGDLVCLPAGRHYLCQINEVDC
ncbi:alpha-tectorin-like [Pyxicephalus adspersus]|uniref:alpha-tectorin-like n=1 Tax=Pyxicephalus adspersus TaxID=30357 RepID=UPI003B5B6390